MTLMINVGSGQRRFDTREGWVNVDCVARPGQIPDVVAHGEALPFPDGVCSIVSLHHVCEHFGCGEAGTLLKECHRVLAKGGSLVICVPDMRALAQRWLIGLIDDFIFFVNTYGAYQGCDGDRHKWGFTKESLVDELKKGIEWATVKPFDWRLIKGADIARAWWILGVEAIK